MLARIAPTEFQPGMLTDFGRVLEVYDEGIRVATAEGVSDLLFEGVSIDVSDRATWWLALDVVAARTGLDSGAGLLWSLQEDGADDGLAWVLESDEESRSRAHDTDDSAEALAHALADTEP